MFGRRSDGKKLKSLEPFYRIIPHVMKNRNDAQNHFLHEVDTEFLDDFIEEQKQLGHDFNYMHIVMAATVRLLALRPQLNRFVMNGRVYKRNEISLAIAIKKMLKDNAPETTVKLPFTGKENIYQVKHIVDQHIQEASRIQEKTGADKLSKILTSTPNFLIKFMVGLIKWMDKHGMAPKSVLKISPFHSSCFITNLKSIKIDYIYHHLYDFGTVGLFISMGKETMQPIVREDGSISAAKIMKLGIVTDERFCDGLYYANSLRKLKKLLENPHVLLTELTHINQDVD